MSLQNRFYLSDFVSIQRNSFLQFLEKGLIEEISKRNPITNQSNTLELFFYSEYYQLAAPKYTLRQAIIKGKSYSSKLYIPVQLTDKRARIIKMKWVHLCDLPVMTKRGHFLINGSARVVINQITRSPGIYYQSKTYGEQESSGGAQSKNNAFERHYADIICQKGTWLRLEIDKNKKIWAQTKKGPKIPIMWLLLAMGLTENQILKSVLEPGRLVYNMLSLDHDDAELPAWEASRVMESKRYSLYLGPRELANREESTEPMPKLSSSKTKLPKYIRTPIEAWEEIYNLVTRQKSKKKQGTSTSKGSGPMTWGEKSSSELGRQLIFNQFMNPRTYDLSKYGRLSINKKFNLNISQYQTALTPQDLLAATDYLLKVEYGLKKVDDIDNLKNRRVRTSGELIQMQFAVGLGRLEKSIKEKMLMRSNFRFEKSQVSTVRSPQLGWQKSTRSVESTNYTLVSSKKQSRGAGKTTQKDVVNKTKDPTGSKLAFSKKKAGISEQQASRNLQKELTKTTLTITKLIPNTKPINSALREFFGTSPLSQFMDQINPLAEITHKRRLSSMGPGGVTSDSATLDIRGIHPSHYGRICPVETPEGKNTGLVNSLTTYARVNPDGYIETPYYQVFKGQVQQKTGMYYLSADYEEKVKLGAADLYASDIGFLSTSPIPVRVESDFTKITRDFVEYTGVSPNQMVSVATSLIPFLEHDDANRALMGSNMQRQSVPLLYPERPIVGTGFEARVVSDSGHALQAHTSGVVTYVSADKVCIYKQI